MPTGIFKCWCRRAHGALKLMGGCWLLIGSAAVAAELAIDKGWVKLAPPGASANAAYLELFNPGDEAVVIQSLSATCCAGLMLHRTRYENDKAIMEHLEQLVVPAQTRINLVPGGIHIMLVRPTPALREGEQVELQLHFANGQQQVIQLPVKANDD